jgi:hypothetical protein
MKPVTVVYRNREDWGRIALINGKFYPYVWNLARAQVTWGNWFAKHSEAGIMYVTKGYDTLQQAKRALWRQTSR